MDFTREADRCGEVAVAFVTGGIEVLDYSGTYNINTGRVKATRCRARPRR